MLIGCDELRSLLRRISPCGKLHLEVTRQLHELFLGVRLRVTLGEVERVFELVLLAAATHCDFKLGHEVSNELEILGVVKQFQLQKGLILRNNCPVELCIHVVDEVLLDRYFSGRLIGY